MAGSLKALSAHRYGRAKEELQTAELLLKNANYRSSINRSYYSIFHAIRAVNALDGFDSSKHSGVIAHFNQEYVKTGVFEKRASKIIRNASELREQAQIMRTSTKQRRRKLQKFFYRLLSLFRLWRATSGKRKFFEAAVDADYCLKPLLKPQKPCGARFLRFFQCVRHRQTNG